MSDSLPELVGVPATWSAPTLSSGHQVALSSYHEGIASLVAGAPFASALLRRAVILDPDFRLARVGLAVANAVAGRPFVSPAEHGTMTRGERQHEEIVRAAFRGDFARATDLRCVHLLEFPGDVLIVWLPASIGGS